MRVLQQKKQLQKKNKFTILIKFTNKATTIY